MEIFRTHIINSLITIILLLSFQSCRMSKLDTSNNISSEEKLPKVAFFTCSLTYDSIQQKYKMSLISKNIVNGKIKESTIDFEENNKRDFRYKFIRKQDTKTT